MGQRSLQVSASYTPSVFQDLKYPRVQLELKLSILHYVPRETSRLETDGLLNADFIK